MKGIREDRERSGRWARSCRVDMTLCIVGCSIHDDYVTAKIYIYI